MKVIECTEINRMSVVNQEKPIISDDKDILIAIKRIGICGTDMHAYSGIQPFFTYPRILGHELSGCVEAIGSKVKNITIGDTVAIIPYMDCGKCIACKNGKTNCCTHMQVLGVHIDGGMKEYITVPSSHVRVVNELTLDEAAMIEPLSIGAHAIRRANIQQGETILVIGAGPIGLGVIRFAQLQGARTIVMDISEERLFFCQEWTNCDRTIKASEDSTQALLDVNDGALPSIVLDATGNKQSMMKAFDYVGHGGRLVYVGLTKDILSFSNPEFHSKEMTLLGSRNATKADFDYVINSMAKGLISHSYITNKIKFNDAVKYFEEGSFRENKTVITLS